MRYVTVGLVLLVALVGSGCSILNPYYEEFDCRKGEGTGKCVDVPTAYAHAKDTESEDNAPVPPPGVNRDVWDHQNATSDGKRAYQESLYQQFAALAKAPATPVMIPPKVLRVLVLSYEGQQGELYMPSYLFVKVDDAKWVMSGGVKEIQE